MKQNRISPDVNHSSMDVPIWTIPMSGVRNENDDLPSYNHFIASQFDNVPPNYFDISIIPKGAVLHYSDIIPYREASKAKIKRKNGGVFSIDPLIDKNPDQLWLYFMTYLNEKPRLIVNILGHHLEYYTNDELYHNRAYSYASRNLERTRTVTDFNYSIDLTAYVSEHCYRVAVIPSKKRDGQNENITFRDVLEQYTHSKKNFREIRCQKQLIGWKFEKLKSKIQNLISSTGYHGSISINFSITNQRILARSSSKLNQFSESMWTRILCVLSCLWIIFTPIYLFLRSIGATRHQIAADYHMISSSDTFLRMNARLITKAALTRSRERYSARTA